MTALLCAIAITITPSPPGCQRGGHATFDPSYERGGHAVVELPPIGPLAPWLCIHRKEAAWTDTGDPYWGGLQMDRGFMLAYGRDMIARYHGWADRWSPRDQMVVAWRAVVGYGRYGPRGYGPWPHTRIGCA